MTGSLSFGSKSVNKGWAFSPLKRTSEINILLILAEEGLGPRNTDGETEIF